MKNKKVEEIVLPYKEGIPPNPSVGIDDKIIIVAGIYYLICCAARKNNCSFAYHIGE